MNVIIWAIFDNNNSSSNNSKDSNNNFSSQEGGCVYDTFWESFLTSLLNFLFVYGNWWNLHVPFCVSVYTVYKYWSKMVQWFTVGE